MACSANILALWTLPEDLPGSRVEDVVNALAILIDEETLVVAGGGNCRILQRNHDDEIILLARVANADGAGAVAQVAEDTAVAAGADHRRLDTHRCRASMTRSTA